MLSAVHDVSSAGLAGALAEMSAVAGAGLVVDQQIQTSELFTETPGRFVVATSDPNGVIARARAAGVAAEALGVVRGDHLVIAPHIDVSLSELRARRSGALEAALDAAR